MGDRLLVPDEDLIALAAGEVIVAFAERNAVDLNDELELVAGGPRGSESVDPPTDHIGLVVGLQPASSLAGDLSVHVPPNMSNGDAAFISNGDAVILRVFDHSGPVLTDDEFESRRAIVEAMFG